MFRKILLPAIASAAIACGSSMADVVQAKQAGAGTSQVYNVPPALAYDIARRVLHSEGMDAIEEHPAEGYFLTSTPSQFFVTQGAYVGVWIEPTPPAPYSRVTVVTKRKAKLDAATGQTENGFHHDFAQALATVQMAPAPAGYYPPPNGNPDHAVR